MNSMRYLKNNGFSLVEMAIVLIIIGLVTGALLLPLQAEYSQLSQSQTETTLANAKQALLGYAQQNGRLPCPASAASNTDAGSYGQENPLGGTRDSTTTQPPVVANTCAMQSGFLPAATLGLQATDKYGFALDAWNNRIRYAISTDDSSSFASPRNASPFITVSTTHPACSGSDAPDFTTSGNMSAVGLICLAPNLRVCQSSATTDCTSTIYLSNNAVAIIFSTGKNYGISAGEDEALNLAATTTFYSRAPTIPTSASSSSKEFDDIMVWISPYVLYNAMIEAGQLH
ncbi:MAG: hypothetical protein RIS87_1179 [Pseudomonadota bacterium]